MRARTQVVTLQQLSDQWRYAWTDGAVVLQFVDVSVDLEPAEAFAILDRFIANTLTHYGG